MTMDVNSEMLYLSTNTNTIEEFVKFCMHIEHILYHTKSDHGYHPSILNCINGSKNLNYGLCDGVPKLYFDMKECKVCSGEEKERILNTTATGQVSHTWTVLSDTIMDDDSKITEFKKLNYNNAFALYILLHNFQLLLAFSVMNVSDSKMVRSVIRYFFNGLYPHLRNELSNMDIGQNRREKQTQLVNLAIVTAMWTGLFPYSSKDMIGKIGIRYFPKNVHLLASLPQATLTKMATLHLAVIEENKRNII